MQSVRLIATEQHHGYSFDGTDFPQPQEVPAMRRVYDVFEKFPDGSTIWRTFVTGRFEAERKMQELAERSGSEFFLIAIQEEDILPTVSARRNSRPLSKSAAG
jgi:hypothetical protein